MALTLASAATLYFTTPFFGIGCLVLITVGYLPVWLAAAFGTGKLESDRPEDEQMRKRRDLAISAILGSTLGGVIAAVLFL
jgi:hypothetical protein